MGEGDALRVDGRPVRVGPAVGEGRTSVVHRLIEADGAEGERVVKIHRAPSDGGAGLEPGEFIAEAARLQALRDAAGADAACFTRVDAVDPDGGWFVMERAPGTPLAGIFRERKILREEQIISVGRQLAAALRAARAVGIRNVDLKLDAIFYEPISDRLVVVDWNVCTPWQLETGWIDPDARLVLAVLDGLLQNAMTEAGVDRLPNWRRRFERPPRWASYPHVFQSALAGLLAEREAQIALDEVYALLTRLSRIIAMPEPELLEHVLAQLDRHRAAPEDGADEIREALGLAQLVTRSRRRTVALRGRAALLASVGLLGGDRGAIARVWASLADSRSQVDVEPGTAPELSRLLCLGRARRRAIGFADRLHRIAIDLAHLKWRDAARGLDDVLRAVEHPAIAEQLRPLVDEAAGMVEIERALGRLDALDPAPGAETDLSVAGIERQRALRTEALGELQRGIDRLARVPWGELLFARLPGILAERDKLMADLGGDALGGGADAASDPERHGAASRVAPIVDRDTEIDMPQLSARWALPEAPVDDEDWSPGDELDAPDTAEQISPGRADATERDRIRAPRPMPDGYDDEADFDDQAPTSVFAATVDRAPGESPAPDADGPLDADVGADDEDEDEPIELPRRAWWPWIVLLLGGVAAAIVLPRLPLGSTGSDATVEASTVDAGASPAALHRDPPRSAHPPPAPLDAGPRFDALPPARDALADDPLDAARPDAVSAPERAARPAPSAVERAPRSSRPPRNRRARPASPPPPPPPPPPPTGVIEAVPDARVVYVHPPDAAVPEPPAPKKTGEIVLPPSDFDTLSGGGRP